MQAKINFIPSFFLLLVAIDHVQITHTANILLFWGMSGYSHRITIWPLVEKLAANGHNITYFSPHQAKTKPKLNPNITEITPPDLFRRIGMDYDPAEVRLQGGVKAIQALWPDYLESGIRLCEFLTTDKDMLDWANSASFDLVFVNGLFNDCALALAYKMKAPTILYGTSSLFPWWGEAYGFPEENYPEFHFHLPQNMTFLQQVWNTFTPLYWHAYRHWYYLPKLEAMVRPALNLQDMPSFSELDKRTSLILSNTHFSEEYPRSLPPWIVFVGGMHCNDNRNPLPEKISSFVNKWEKGFIYFSFGTYMRLPLLPQRQKEAIFGAIKKFPDIGIIMKWNGGPVPDDLPENVLTAEWLAQQDILAHPKARAFISHGGLLSTQEAVYHGVPIIVFPIFAEQDYNAQRIHTSERGIMMEISDLTAEKLENAIRDVLTNKKYKENIELVSRIFRDRPSHPVDTAAWWVEYVLRHKNTSFLRPVGVTRTWYERRMLHVWGFVALVLGIGLAISFLIMRTIVATILDCQKTQKLKQQ